MGTLYSAHTQSVDFVTRGRKKGHVAYSQWRGKHEQSSQQAYFVKEYDETTVRITAKKCPVATI
jgi:hypothetical protein